MDATARFTREDLIREANAIRPGATDRLVTDWVEIGLWITRTNQGSAEELVRAPEPGLLPS